LEILISQKHKKMKNFKLCVSLSESNFPRCYAYAKQAEMAELRLDSLHFTEDELKTIFSLPIPVIATCRAGKFEDKERIKCLKQAIRYGAKYVDIEIDTPESLQKELLSFAAENNCKTIISYHNFEETPPLSQIEKIMDSAKKLLPWKIKIATFANSQQDMATILSLYAKHRNLIAFCMGEQGVISRLTSLFLGAEFTYVSADKNHSTAPGQPDIETMKKWIETFNVQ